ncbi:MAG: hypothetical protein U1F36_00230 [Planctomycetota bacterium]
MSRIFRAHHRLALSGLLAALAAPAQAQNAHPFLAPFGTGCPNATGVGPALQGFGLPALGTSMKLAMTLGVPGDLGFLLFGLAPLNPPLDLGFVGSPGCLLLTMPDLAVLSAPIGATGTAGMVLQMPSTPALAGAQVTTQWLEFDFTTLHFSTSRGAVAGIAAVPPAMSIGTITPTSGSLSVGQTITLRVTNLGTQDPDDLCLRIFDLATGQSSLLRAQSIVFDPNTGEDVVTAKLVTANTPYQIANHVMLMRGTGDTVPTSGSGCLVAPPSAWGWGGADLNGSGALAPTGLFTLADTSTSTVHWVLDTTAQVLYVDIPIYPFGNGGVYPPNSSAKLDAHGNLDCGNNVPPDHFDKFMETLIVSASCNGGTGLTNQQLATELAPRVQETFDLHFGAGRLTITANTTGSMARIEIRSTDPACTMTSGGGSVVLHQ